MQAGDNERGRANERTGQGWLRLRLQANTCVSERQRADDNDGGDDDDDLLHARAVILEVVRGTTAEAQAATQTLIDLPL